MTYTNFTKLIFQNTKGKIFLEVTKFLLEKMGYETNKPFKRVLAMFDKVKAFVAIEWEGHQHVLADRPARENKGVDRNRCNCGGFMVKRQNRSDKSFFLGCNNYPKCKNTKPYLL